MKITHCATVGCSGDADHLDPLPLCTVCALEVARNVVPAVLASALDQSLALRQNGPEAMTDQAVRVVLPPVIPAQHEPVVYFLKNGGRVKIGTSRALGKRLRGLSLSRNMLVLVLSGGSGLEHNLHRRFEPLRVEQTEWFNYSGPLRAYVGERKKNAPHMALEVPLKAAQGTTLRKVSTEEARAVMEDRLRSLLEAHPKELNVDHFGDIPGKIGRSRAWLYTWLDSQAQQGRLIKISGTYRVPLSKEKDDVR